MALHARENIAASKELVNAVMEVVGCHDSSCSWGLTVTEDDVFLNLHHTWSVIFIGRLEKHQHVQKNLNVVLQWES